VFLAQACGALPLDPGFLVEEAEYVMGRFLPDYLETYLGARRDGRGTAPRMERPMRQRLLAEVISPYRDWKAQKGLLDWNDLAVLLTSRKLPTPLDVVIIDEAQDFSANQVRAILAQLRPIHALTFVMDSVQRIYARGFTWSEIGISIPTNRNRRLSRNYRNTVEIARLAQGLVRDLPLVV
jgi:superfamily I DNA/RNA helicase